MKLIILQSEAGVRNTFSLSLWHCCLRSQNLVVCWIDCGMSLKAEQPHHGTFSTQTCLDRQSAPPGLSKPICHQLQCEIHHILTAPSHLCVSAVQELHFKSTKMQKQQNFDIVLMEWWQEENRTGESDKRGESTEQLNRTEQVNEIDWFFWCGFFFLWLFLTLKHVLGFEY